ncbi:hypothetical protein Tco_1004666 [Tanacetum coccineum]|uniref:Aminotransferase-like plant mobile domain-containing protein n=1 Tax=Tanacetum coccineum TaxID=301880 RepID=A0ABQ5FDU0_9ASTR
MADENVPAPAPTRSDYQILPFAAWVPIRKRNYVLDLQKKQKNPIFQISVDILQNTNFFRAFTTFASLDETRFVLDANLLREVLEITPIDQANQFMSPPLGDVVMDFVNELGYPEEEFVQAIQIVLTNKANLGSPTKKGRKDKPHVILFCRFTKLIICHLGRIHNIHQRSTSLFHLAEEDLTSTQAIEKSSKPVPAPKPKVTKEKPSKASTAKSPKPKPAKEKSTKDTPLQKAGNGKVTKVRTMKSTFQLVDKPDEEPAYSEPKPEPEYQGEEATRPLPIVEGKGKAIVTEEQATQSLLALHTPKRRSIIDQFILQRRTPTTEEASTGPSTQLLDDTSANIVHDSLSPVDAETGAGSDKKSRGGDTEAGPDPGETHESQPLPDQAHMNEDQARPDPRISRESLKFPADEHVLLEDPLSSTRTLLSMKNLENAYAIGDQFINDKSSDDEPGKLNVEVKVVSMVTVSIYQSSSSVPPLSTPVIDLSPPKPASSATQAPIFIAITMTTTPLPPPLQQQSTTKSKLVERVAALEKKLSDLEQTNKNLDNITQNLGSRVYTLEVRDLPYKIDEIVHENVKEATDEFLAENDKSSKQRRDDQDPYPPPPDSDISKRRRHDTGASGSSQPVAPHPHDEQPVEDIPIPDSANISDSEDIDSAHLLKIKQKTEWLKPIPPSHIPDAINKWANALATTYQAPVENSLIEKTGDMRTFMNWYDYLKEITLRSADYQEYTIAEKDFKNLYPSDFEDLNLLLLQGHLNHLSGSDKRMLSTAVNLWTRNLLNLTKPGWDAKGFEYKHDYKIIESPRVVVFPVGNNERKIMRMWKGARNSYMPLNKDSRPEGSSGIWNALLVDGFTIFTTDFFRVRNDLFIPFISQNRRDLPRDIPLDSVEALRYDEKRSKVRIREECRLRWSYYWNKPNKVIVMKYRIIIRVLRIILVVLPEHSSDTYVFTMKMEILLEPTSNKLMLNTLDVSQNTFSSDTSIDFKSISSLIGKLGDSDVNALEDPTLILEILSRRFFLRLNILDHRSDLIGSGVKMEMEIPPSSGVYFINACSYSTHTSKELMKAQVTTNNQAFTIKKGTSMPVQMSQTQDGERPHVDDQRLDLADDLKEAQDHISSSITSHKTKITTSKYKRLRKESKTTS